MKVFLDSSVIIAALLSEKGASAQVLLFCEGGFIEGVISTQVLKELHDVMRRKFPKVILELEELIQLAEIKVMRIRSKKQVEEAKKWIQDPKDAHVLAAARQARVDVLLTLDLKDFIKDKRVAQKSKLTIMSPGDFVNTLLASQKIK